MENPYGRYLKNTKSNTVYREEEFFKWVEKHNGVSRDYIVAGKDLVVPIKSEPIAIDEVQELASR